ncbi:MAG: hypothetical protein IJF61_02965 [Clostridia bacterium]|nr:hypothetical protein [Clostridia bacterium]
MKRYLAIALGIFLILSALPVMAAPASGVEVMGNFQGNLLATGHDATYDLILKNNEGTEQKVSVVLAKYAGNTLKEATPETVTLDAGERFEKTYTVTDVTEDITSVRAYVLNSADSVQPLIRSDEINLTYGSIYNDYDRHNTVSVVTEGVLSDEEVAAQFPVHEAFRSTWQKYVVNGASMLAYFETAPDKIYVGLSHRANSSSEPVKFEQFRTARVIDPNGKVVCYYDFSAEGSADGVIFDVPEYTGEPGIWTISYCGGLHTCDEVTIGIPQTPYYGIRGDMIIGLNHKTMLDKNGDVKKWYIYVPESCVGADAVFMIPNNHAGVLPTVTKADGTEIPEIFKANGNVADLEPRLHSRLMCDVIEEEDADTVWTLSFDDWMTYFGTPENVNIYHYWPVSGNVSFNGLYVGIIEGLPGLLCNSKEAAMKLKGGIATSSDGRTLGGVVQARARDASLDIVNNGDLTVDVDFVSEMPEQVRELGMGGVEALIAGDDSGLSDVAYACRTQNLNPNDIFLGSLQVTEFKNGSLDYRKNFEDFTYHNGSWRDIYSAGNLAAYAGLPTKLNPLYGDTAMVNRAALATLSHIVEMSPEHMIRGYGITYTITRDEQGNITNTSYGDYWPCERTFFTIPGLCQAYNLLKDKVSPEVSKIMRNAVILMGDKLANYMANDTNQWSEILMAHMEIYMATGEERFLRYFERAVEGIGEPPVDYNSLGQNSTGAFLERMAPSAGYGNQVMHNLYPCYYIYKGLPNRDEAVFATLHDIVDRYVTWEALNWMPVGGASGSTYSATAIMAKGVNQSYGAGGGVYPNFSYASVGFPLANTLLQLRQNRYTTSLDPDLIYRLPELGEAMLEQNIFNVANPLAAASDKRTNYASVRSYEIFTQEPWTDETATLPVYETDKVWKSEDLLAWKKNGVYAMHFYANPYSTTKTVNESLLAYRGGLPFAVWSEGTGPVVLSQHLNDGTTGVTGKNDKAVYYSGVYVTLKDGTVHQSRGANGTITEENSQGHTIVSPLCHHLTSGEGTYGSLTYKTTYTQTGFTVDVTYTPTDAAADYKEAHIVLPIFTKRSGRYYDSPNDSVGVFHSVITQSADKKTLNYKSTVEGSYGSMNIHSSTAATFDETRGYGTFGTHVIQRLMIPLDANGKATITFELVNQ